MFYKPSTTKLSQKLKYDIITQEKQGWRQILNKKIGWVYFLYVQDIIHIHHPLHDIYVVLEDTA